MIFTKRDRITKRDNIKIKSIEILFVRSDHSVDVTT